MQQEEGFIKIKLLDFIILGEVKNYQFYQECS